MSRCPLKLPLAHWKILNALVACRTPALGGHRYVCGQCGREHFVPHSCGNRHCPQCQGAQARDWLERQAAVLLPVPYFHVVFTLPHALNPLIRQNQRAMFNLLFGAASQTLLQFGRNKLKAQLGITAVLHTWGQTLIDHYHVHCIVTGGGLGLEQSGWISSPDHYLFAVRALSKVFAGKFRAGLQALHAQGKLEFHGQIAPLATRREFGTLLAQLKKTPWVVYAKQPFAGPEQVLAYLSRYTHRVAISNPRLLSLDEHSVRFSYKDYTDRSRRKTMILSLEEFTRRFCLHLLPRRFVKIRHYGLLANRDRQERIDRARRLLGVKEEPLNDSAPEEAPPTDAAPAESGRLRCPHCGACALIWIEELPPRPKCLCDTS